MTDSPPRMNMIADLIRITDDYGRLVESSDPGFNSEPQPASVVLTQGPYGTAWQRHFSDGMWYRLGSARPRTWEWLLNQRNLFVAYDAPRRAANQPVPLRDTTPVLTNLVCRCDDSSYMACLVHPGTKPVVNPAPAPVRKVRS